MRKYDRDSEKIRAQLEKYDRNLENTSTTREIRA